MTNQSYWLNCFKYNRHLGFFVIIRFEPVLVLCTWTVFKSNNHRILWVYLVHILEVRAHNKFYRVLLRLLGMCSHWLSGVCCTPGLAVLRAWVYGLWVRLCHVYTGHTQQPRKPCSGKGCFWLKKVGAQDIFCLKKFDVCGHTLLCHVCGLGKNWVSEEVFLLSDLVVISDLLDVLLQVVVCVFKRVVRGLELSNQVLHFRCSARVLCEWRVYRSINTHLNVPKYPKRIPRSTERVRLLHEELYTLTTHVFRLKTPSPPPLCICPTTTTTNKQPEAVRGKTEDRVFLLKCHHCKPEAVPRTTRTISSAQKFLYFFCSACVLCENTTTNKWPSESPSVSFVNSFLKPTSDLWGNGIAESVVNFGNHCEFLTFANISVILVGGGAREIGS